MVQDTADRCPCYSFSEINANEFIKKVIEVGNTDFKHLSSIYKIFQKWKASGIAAPGRGRPLKVHIAEAEKEVSNILRSRSTNCTQRFRAWQHEGHLHGQNKPRQC